MHTLAAVDEFYSRLVNIRELDVFFDGVNMAQLKKHQFNFMRMAFTKIPEGTDVSGKMVKAHERLWDLGLDETHFDIIATELVGTLKKLNVGQREIDDVVATVGPLRKVFEVNAIKNQA